MSEEIQKCPVCHSEEQTLFLRVRDHFLSGEDFNISHCTACGFRFVTPRPGADEIGRYYQSEEYISHDTGRKNLITRIYTIARYFSIRGKFRIVKSRLAGGKILDIGCGTGEFLRYCKSKGFSVTGVEPNEKARSFARDQNDIPVSDDLAGVFEKDETFDCITMWHVLEHVHELDLTLCRIRDMLTPGGTLIVAVPNSNSPDAAEYGSFWAAWDVPRHIYHFTYDSMVRLMGNYGFKIAGVKPQKLDAYYVSMLSEKYRSGKKCQLYFPPGAG